jgi:serine/threonine protein kinase
VAYIHFKGVVHRDLGLYNFLLHNDGRLILCDFAGSGLDDLPPNVSAGVRYLNPLFDSDYPSERDDVFALGTVLYELDRGERLFDGKSDQKIRQCLCNKQFPDLSLVSSLLRRVIKKC